MAGRSRDRDFGTSWWAQKWLAVLESYGWSSRLQRGRTYARGGKVLEITVDSGHVSARVQGSRPRPYRVSIEIPPLGDAEWGRVVAAMAGQAVFAARLLAGEMPEDVEAVFKGCGVPLFPKASSDVKAECSCPDWANPCKHIAAVYYILGREFDRDPFVLFFLRGRGREEIIEALRQARAPKGEPAATPGAGASAGGPDVAAAAPAGSAESAESAEDPLAQLRRFWTGDEEAYGSLSVSLDAADSCLAALKRLGPPPDAMVGEAAGISGPELVRVLEGYYELVSRKALGMATR